MPAAVAIRDEATLRWSLAAEILRGRQLTRLRGYAERADPWAYIRDVLGTRLTPQQEAVVELIEANDWSAIPSGNNLGKTFVVAEYVLYRFHPVALLADEEDGLEHQGARALLMGPDHGTIERTIYAEILKLASRAEERGWPMPGDRSLASVSWRVDGPAIWRMEPFSPARKARQEVSSKASGRHHRNLIVVIEEGMGVEESTFAGAEGMASSAGNKIVVPFNATESATTNGAALYSRCRGEGRRPYATLHLSAMDHPNVRTRSAVFPAAIDHHTVDERIRFETDDLGAVGEVEPDPLKHDFLYALPPPGAEERGGREDGIAGHPDGEPRVRRPSRRVVTQLLGQFVEDGTARLFVPRLWDEAVARGRQTQDPAESPDRVGIDAAREGGDEIVGAPAWGNTAAEYLEAWREIQLMVRGSPERAATLQDGLRAHRARIGALVVIPPGDGPDVAARIHQRWPSSPLSVDIGNVGASVYDHLRRVLGRQVGEVVFGSSPDEMIAGEVPCVNLRAQMYLRFAALLRYGLVDVPPDPLLRQEAMVVQTETVQRTVETPQGKRLMEVTKIRGKEELKAELDRGGRGFDRLDAVVMSLTKVRLRDEIGSFRAW